MFRRREDSLFDNTTDSGQPEQGAEESSMASSQPATASGQSFSGTSSFTPPSTQTSRPAQERGASSAQPASSFRPGSASQTSDLGRNRMPEAKPAGTAASFASNPAPAATSFMPPVGEKKGGPKRVLTVGNDILLKGEIATCDRLVIEGKVDATLNDVHTVEIAEHGSFRGSAHIEDAEISGLFEGDLVVRNRLVIYATGKVRGKITYGEIEIERGGELTGEIKTTTTQQAVSPRRAPKDDKVAA